MTSTQPARKQASLVAARLRTAAFCMFAFAVLVWPVWRLWQRPVRDWQMIVPALGMIALMALGALMSIGMAARAKRREAPARPRVDRSPAIKPAAPAFVYPAPSRSLPESFRFIVAQAVNADAATRAELERVYELAVEFRHFRMAEDYVLRLAAGHPAFDKRTAYVEPINAANPALFIDQVDGINQLAGTVAALVLVAHQVPERVWDLIVDPWLAADMRVPQLQPAT